MNELGTPSAAGMQIFVYEFICGGGMWALGDELPAGSLLEEGRSMLQALVRDLAAIDGVRVCVTRDARLTHLVHDLPPEVQVETIGHRESERTVIAKCARTAQATILIAPEFYGLLAERCGWVTTAGGCLWSPPIEFVQAASSKSETVWRLRTRHVAVPDGMLWLPGNEWPPRDAPAEPLVLKPDDGCGSQEVRGIFRREDWPREPPREPTRIEQFIPGRTASIALLTGPQGVLFPLPACYQHLTSDGTFRYVGGSLPLEESLQNRAQRLATSALQAMPATCGYVGVDFILGDAADGSKDFVIEINPRLTTSYVGLRKLCRGNLAEAMIHVCRGEEVSLWFDEGPIEFAADGQLPRDRSVTS